jgi:hypothetical protein
MEIFLDRYHVKEDGTIGCNTCDFAAQLKAVVITHVQYVHEKVSFWVKVTEIMNGTQHVYLLN